MILTLKACASAPELAKENIIRKTASSSPSSHGSTSKQRIKDKFQKVELSVSPYDTAWVAMVPSPNIPETPCFPECLNWLLENQFDDGSWAIPPGRHIMVKDSMLSTLTSVVALSRWQIGEEHVRKGLNFMKIYSDTILDNTQKSLTGFDIIFPGMIEHAKDLGLRLPMSSKCFDEILYKRDHELERVSNINSEASKAYLAYVSEGMTKSYDWKESMRYQRRNGSLFNSPSTTASLLTHHHDQKCFLYLQSVLNKFGSAVPTVYPISVYIRLCMIDRLVAMGIDRHFENEIEHALDETYRCWQENDEDIFLDAETCSLAFRLLRTHGYEVSSHALEEFKREQFFPSSPGHNLKEIYSILELYKASKIASPDELLAKDLHSWTSHFLKHELSDSEIHEKHFHGKVDEALRFKSDTSLDRLENRRSVESYEEDIRSLKVMYRSPNLDGEDYLELGVEDYNFVQGIHQNELKNLERWMVENRLDKIKFVRHKLTYTHFCISSLLGAPEYTDARIAWTKNIVLITMVDDLFDAGGSRKELLNLIELVDRWDDIKEDDDYSSEQVKIMFVAIWKTITELASMAFIRQGRDVTRHMVETWLDMIKGMMFEYECGKDTSNVPTVDEYMAHAHNSIGAGPSVLIALYFLGPKLSAEVVNSVKYKTLYKHMGFCCRLLNDLQTYKRESAQGKLNSVLLSMVDGGASLEEEEGVRKMKSLLNSNQRGLLSIARNPLPTVVPRVCKELFWNGVKVAHYLYNNNDGFNSPMAMVKDLNELFYEPLEVHPEQRG